MDGPNPLKPLDFTLLARLMLPEAIALFTRLSVVVGGARSVESDCLGVVAEVREVFVGLLGGPGSVGF